MIDHRVLDVGVVVIMSGRRLAATRATGIALRLENRTISFFQRKHEHVAIFHCTHLPKYFCSIVPKQL